MKKFFKIFKAGKYPQGEITAADVEEIATNYNPSFHEAPLILLHDEKSPAYAVVDEVIAANGELYASFKDMIEEAYDVNKKYKKPSIEIAEYDNKKYLRAVALTNFPQVKGMDKITFDEKSSIFFSEDLTLNLNKGDKMPDNKNEITVEQFTEVNNQLAATKAEIAAKEAELKKFSEAGITIEKFNELKAKVDGMAKQQVADLIEYAIKQKGMLPAQTDGLKKFAETNFDEAKKFVDALPDKKEPPKNFSFKVDGKEKPITYEDVLKDPSLAKNFSEEQLMELKKNSNLF